MAKMMRRYKAGLVQIRQNHKTDGAIDPVRGCIGCELRDQCYAKTMAGIGRTEFFQPVVQTLDERKLTRQLRSYRHDWIRIGCTGDPSLAWATTARVVELCAATNVRPVVVTKVHERVPGNFLAILAGLAQVQVSVSGLEDARQRVRRLGTVERLTAAGGDVVLRLVSGAWRDGSPQAAEQDRLVSWANQRGLPILDTPLRVFRTTAAWDLLDQAKYRRHVSPISGQPGCRYCAGLLIDQAFPCYSTCSPTATRHDPGCPHQCATRRGIA